MSWSLMGVKRLTIAEKKSEKFQITSFLAQLIQCLMLWFFLIIVCYWTVSL